MKNIVFVVLVFGFTLSVAAQSQILTSFKAEFKSVEAPFSESFRFLKFDKTKPLSELYPKWIFGKSGNDYKIYPVAFVKIYNDQYVSCFYRGNDEKYNSIYVATFSNNGELIDTVSYNLDGNNSINGFSIDINEGGEVYIIRHDFVREPTYIYSGNSAQTGGGAIETKETLHQYRILLNGTFEEGISASELFLSEYFIALSEGDFKKAYSMQKVSLWGSYEEFSATSAFGAITSAVSDDIHVVSEDENTISVFSHTLYTDTVNWGIEVSQVFILRKNASGFYIESMKILDYKKKMKYSCSDFMDSGLSLQNITEEGFDFYFNIISDQKMPDNWSNKAGYMNGYAKFFNPEHAVSEGDCTLHFYFKGKSTVEVKEMNCSEYRHKDLNFGGIYVYENLSF